MRDELDAAPRTAEIIGKGIVCPVHAAGPHEVPGHDGDVTSVKRLVHEARALLFRRSVNRKRKATGTPSPALQCRCKDGQGASGSSITRYPMLEASAHASRMPPCGSARTTRSNEGCSKSKGTDSSTVPEATSMRTTEQPSTQVGP